MSEQEPLLPQSSATTRFIAAGFALLAVTGGLLFYKLRPTEEPTSTPDTSPTTPTASASPALLEDPPPPPPPVANEAAPASVETAGARKGGTGTHTAAVSDCDSPCEGSMTGALRAALRAKAGLARGCYERALMQNSMLRGKLVVDVRIGATGRVCSASVARDNLGDETVKGCVLQRFRAGNYPPPQGGCIKSEVPMNFVPKN